MLTTTSRDEYVAQLKRELDRLNAQIGRWEAQGKAGADRLQPQLEALRQQRSRALSKLRLLG